MLQWPFIIHLSLNDMICIFSLLCLFNENDRGKTTYVEGGCWILLILCRMLLHFITREISLRFPIYSSSVSSQSLPLSQEKEIQIIQINVLQVNFSPVGGWAKGRIKIIYMEFLRPLFAVVCIVSQAVITTRKPLIWENPSLLPTGKAEKE